MTRARVLDSLLALLAVAAVVAPVRMLFTPDTWVPWALVMALSVTVSGMLMRALTHRDAAVVVTQIVVGVLLAGWLFAREHLWFGLPRWQTVVELNTVLVEARETITSFAPPAPTGRGVILAMALLVWVAMLLVDFLAVTRGSPAMAGVALFAAFLIAASNSGAGMPVAYFLVGALLWLALLGRSGLSTLPRRDTGSALRGQVANARRIGVSAIVIAALTAALLPHLPTRFLLEGLGRSTDSTGSTGTMTINSTVNLARSLESQSTDPVLQYRTSAPEAAPLSAATPDPAPLRVAILDLYQGGQWREREVLGIPRRDALEATPVDAASDTYTFSVSDNRLAAPQIALPQPATSLTIDAQWQSRSDGTVLVDRRVQSYSAQYISREPDEETLQASGPPPIEIGNRTPDADSADAVADILSEIITPEMSQIDKARAIQAHLRGPEYTYSLELAGPTVDQNGNLVQLDPLSHFLLTRQGYCTQFASAMVMMARAEGIAARFAIGFLPGTAARDGQRTVIAADAHAWPELYFDDIGWLRFEPTPATRSGGSPDYTAVPTEGTDGSTSTSSSTATSAPVPTRERPEDIPLGGADLPAGESTARTAYSAVADRFGWLVTIALLGLLGAAAMPASAWWERRRRRRQAVDDAARVEVIWQDMLERLDDVGLTPPPDATPRQTGTYIWDEAFLTKESRGALTRVVAAVEQARYARPDSAAQPELVSAVEHDAHIVSDNVVTSLRRGQRWRATWWPTAGVSAWRRVRESVVDRLPWLR